MNVRFLLLWVGIGLLASSPIHAQPGAPPLYRNLAKHQLLV